MCEEYSNEAVVDVGRDIVITQGLVLQVHQRVHERESGKSLGTTRDPFFSQVRASDRVTSRILAVYPS